MSWTRARTQATVLAAALTVTIAACTSSDSSETTTLPPITLAPPTTTNPAPASADRLAISDDVGRIVLVDRDGSNPEPLTSISDGTYFQPVWSPDRLRIAAGFTDGATASLSVVEIATGDEARSPAAAVPFYHYWSPDSAKVGYLNNSAVVEGLDMTVFDLAENEAILVGMGAPFYFSWSPDSAALATHVGLDGLEIRPLDGDPEALDDPGLFQAPSWTERGILYVAAGDSTQSLVLTADADVTVAELMGPAAVVPSPDGSRVAISSMSDQTAVSALAQAAPTLPANRLVVLDLETLEWATVTSDDIAAFFWSPDGSRILYLGAELRGEDLDVAWRVWDTDGSTTTFESFAPGPMFISGVLPFFDQYAQSMSLWAPDGNAFAYPAVVDGVTSIVVQDVAGGEAVPIAEGTWVSWASAG